MNRKANNPQEQNRIQSNCNALPILSSFQPKLSRQESVTYGAGVGEAVHRNSLSADPALGFKRQRLQISGYKYVQGIKENVYLS